VMALKSERMLTHMADLFLPARLFTALSKQNANCPPQAVGFATA